MTTYKSVLVWWAVVTLLTLAAAALIEICMAVRVVMFFNGVLFGLAGSTAMIVETTNFETREKSCTPTT